MSAVIFEKRNGVAYATLNSEASLNSLTMEMIDLLTPQLAAWARDPEVALVVLKGAGEKAFCAGGDVRQLHACVTTGRQRDAERFFEKEYQLDYAIHVYPKPLVVWGHGIVMGGGLGLMAGASHRVVTEATKMAMPEITIGLYPDVGASHFLQKMPAGVGLFLGLTGARLNATDCLFTGLGNAFIARERRDELFKELEQTKWSKRKVVDVARLNEILARFEYASLPARPVGEIERRLPVIQELTTQPGVAEFAARLRTHLDSADKFMAIAAKTFLAGSPTSMRVIWAQLHRLRGLSLRECFVQEMTLSTQFAHHTDLGEGIRALLIDKDNQPKWQPARLEDVADALVEKHFTWPHSDRPNPLENQA